MARVSSRFKDHGYNNSILADNLSPEDAQEFLKKESEKLIRWGKNITVFPDGSFEWELPCKFGTPNVLIYYIN